MAALFGFVEPESLQHLTPEPGFPLPGYLAQYRSLHDAAGHVFVGQSRQNGTDTRMATTAEIHSRMTTGAVGTDGGRRRRTSNLAIEW